MLKNQGLPHVLTRQRFYRQSFRYVELIVVLLIFLIIGLIAFIVYQRSTFPPPKYFATTPDGVPIARIPLNVPLLTPDAVVVWAEKAIIDIYSLDFVSYRRTLQDAQVYFTLQGYFEFKNAYQASRNLEAVKEKRQVVSAKITGPSKLVGHGPLTENGTYSWNLEVPVTVTYQNSVNEVIQQVGVVLMRIQRASLVEHPEGVAIAQLILQAE